MGQRYQGSGALLTCVSAVGRGGARGRRWGIGVGGGPEAGPGMRRGPGAGWGGGRVGPRGRAGRRDGLGESGGGVRGRGANRVPGAGGANGGRKGLGVADGKGCGGGDGRGCGVGARGGWGEISWRHCGVGGLLRVTLGPHAGPQGGSAPLPAVSRSSLPRVRHSPSPTRSGSLRRHPVREPGRSVCGRRAAGGWQAAGGDGRRSRPWGATTG